MSRRHTGQGRAEGAALSGDDSDCPILHVDMDAFYASVELVGRPSLRGLPVIVGGSGRSVVLSATYEARRLGIHAAMPMARARRLCPQAAVIEPDHARYGRVSRAVMEIFRSVTPLVEPLSLDEAFLDVGGALRRLGSSAAIARSIRERVARTQGITCSVGVASTKFVAKLASDYAKPDGLLVVPHQETLSFLHPLPVGALWGVGDRTEAALTRFGIRTVAGIAHTPVETLQRILGEAAGRHLYELAWGRDPREVVPEHPEKSIGAEATFEWDVAEHDVLYRELLRLSAKVARRLRAAGMAGRTVSVKVRFADFTTLTRSRTVPETTDVARTIYGVARELVASVLRDGARVRLLGVRVENLAGAHGHRQLLLGERPRGWGDAERAMDRVGARFGVGAVRPATLVAVEEGRRGADRSQGPDGPGIGSSSRTGPCG